MKYYYKFLLFAWFLHVASEDLDDMSIYTYFDKFW